MMSNNSIASVWAVRINEVMEKLFEFAREISHRLGKQGKPLVTIEIQRWL